MDKFEERRAEFEKVCKGMAELFDKKNRDYGDSYFEEKEAEFPIDRTLERIDFYVQIKRKFSRLASFAEKRLKGEEAKSLIDDETEEDTIMDTGIYCIMELLKRRKQR